jgi:hypothetical protein
MSRSKDDDEEEYAERKIFSPLLCRLSYLAVRGGEEQGIWDAGFPAQANSSRTIEIDGLNLAVVAVHVQSDRTAANFAILNRGKRAGRGVDDSGEDRSAVGANNARLYFKVHRPM